MHASQENDRLSPRPSEIVSPYGALTLDDLPPAGFAGRWTIRRKVELLAAVNGRLLAEAEVEARYGLSAGELDAWRRNTLKAGVDGVSVSRNQLHRGARLLRHPDGYAHSRKTLTSRARRRG